MIATPVLNRVHDESRASRTTRPQEIITDNAAAHAPSPACGGGAERSEAEGVFVHPTTTTEAQPNDPAQQIPTLPEGKNLSRFLDAFLDGSFSIPSICDEFELTVFEVLALLESTEVRRILETLKKIATIRQDTIAAQARVTAIHRLSELATYAHTADAVEARALETARKAAAQIIRTTNPNRRVPQATRKAIPPRHDQRLDEPTVRVARTGGSKELRACDQGSSICGAASMVSRRIEQDSSEIRCTKRDSSENRRTWSRATDLALEVSAVGPLENTDLQSKVSATTTVGSEIRPTKTPSAGPDLPGRPEVISV